MCQSESGLSQLSPHMLLNKTTFLLAQMHRNMSQHAKEACQLLTSYGYKQDLWMWDQDWSLKTLKMKRFKGSGVKQVNPAGRTLEEKFKGVMDTAKHLYKVQPSKPGYPAWYQALCPKPAGGFAQPTELSASKAVVPKLLRLCWKGYPLHRHKNEKWGYLQPNQTSSSTANNVQRHAPLQVEDEHEDIPQFPVGVLGKFLASAEGHIDGGRNQVDGGDMDLAYELRDLRPDDSDESAFLSKVDTPVPDNSIQLEDAPGCIFTRYNDKFWPNN